MTLAQQFTDELTQEAATTRRLLERVPERYLTWKPHSKSMSMGQLALHIAQLPRGIANLIDDLVTGVPNVPLDEAKSQSELMAALDDSVAFATRKLAEWGDDGLAQTWRMTREGQTLLEMPRAAMFRSIMLNHWYHHRGQLTVYLRLQDVPLPPVFGPTADAKLF